MSAEPDALPDLTGRYELGEALGRGAHGAVHRARERATGRAVAVKLLQAGRSPAALTRFLREGAVVASLEHPGIVGVHAVGIYRGTPCIVYELVEGEPLDVACRALDLRRRVELVRDAALGVGHAHARGVLHRDLKPANILVDRAGRVRVLDFGLALVEGEQRLTRTGALLGTPTHMAPELFSSGAAAPTPRSDVWALGVILYQTLTGRLPFEGATLVALAAQIEAGRPPAPSSIDPAVPRAVEEVCSQALARDPARRPADGAELAARLERALAGRAGSRLPAAGFGAFAALLAALAGLVVLVRARHQPGPSSGLAAPAPERSGASPAADVAAPATSALEEEPLRALTLDEGVTHGRWGLALGAGRVLIGGGASPVRLWDARRGVELRAWPLLQGVREAARLPGGRVLLAGPAQLLRLELEGEPVAIAGVDPPTRSLATASAAPRAVLLDARGARARLFDPDAGRELSSLPAEGELQSCALSADGRWLSLGLREQLSEGDLEVTAGSLLVYDLADPARPTLLRRVSTLGLGVANQVRARAEAAGGGWVLGLSTQRLATLEPGPEGALRLFPTGMQGAHELRIEALAVSLDGRTAFSAARRSERELEVRRWDLPRGEERGEPRVARGKPIELDVSPEGDLLVIGTNQGVHLRPLSPP